MKENDGAEKTFISTDCRITKEEKFSSMLSVGREIDINDKSILCSDCAWEGTGMELSCGLMRVSRQACFLYAYRCPACLSFNIMRKGKLLKFRPPESTLRQEKAFDEL